MKRSIAVLATVAALLGNPAMSGATVIDYTESAFLASNPIVSTETFDEYPKGHLFMTPVVTIDSVTYEALPDPDDGESVWRAGIHFGVPGYVSSPNDFGSNWITDNILSFGTGRYVHGIGFWLLSGTHRSGLVWEILAEETDGSVDVVGVWDWSNDQRYFGFSSPLGFRSITVRDFAGDSSRSNWSFDNVSRTESIPEPSTVALLVMGAVGLLVCRRRR
jgi:hypothetical protein